MLRAARCLVPGSPPSGGTPGPHPSLHRCHQVGLGGLSRSRFQLRRVGETSLDSPGGRDAHCLHSSGRCSLGCGGEDRTVQPWF